MSDPASRLIDESGMAEMIFTNSIPFKKDCKKCATIISVARMFCRHYPPRT